MVVHLCFPLLYTKQSTRTSYNNGKVQIIPYCVFWLLISGSWDKLQRNWVLSEVLGTCAQGLVKMNLECRGGKPGSGRPPFYGSGSLFLCRLESSNRSNRWHASVMRRATESSLCIASLSVQDCQFKLSFI